jgi:cell division septation protein DedD
MSTAQQDTEITLGTGHMLAIFFILVLVCAFFFAIGFSLGRRTALAGVLNPTGSSAGVSATAVRPSAAKTDASQPQASDFSFYKAVGEKNADATIPAQNAKVPPANSASNPASSAAALPAADTAPSAGSKTAPDAASATPAGSGYYVQVAAVSRQEDAEALVEALKKKQYPAFTASITAGDKFYRVQVGPYSEVKDAEAMRARLISDGYNPIVKK